MQKIISKKKESFLEHYEMIKYDRSRHLKILKKTMYQNYHFLDGIYIVRILSYLNVFWRGTQCIIMRNSNTLQVSVINILTINNNNFDIRDI